jgi:hypothetical protein
MKLSQENRKCLKESAIILMSYNPDKNAYHGAKLNCLFAALPLRPLSLDCFDEVRQVLVAITRVLQAELHCSVAWLGGVCGPAATRQLPVGFPNGAARFPRVHASSLGEPRRFDCCAGIRDLQPSAAGPSHRSRP